MTRPSWALAALATAAFAIGTTEFAPMGLLPVIADGVSVDIPQAGMLITAYALGVTVGAPVMTLAMGKLPTRRALVALMAIFVLGNGLSSVAPGFWPLVAARVITSLAHGAFFGLGSVMAASLVAKERRASAVATMFLGLTVANIGGVPAATWLGQQVGWRMAFGATAILGALAIVALMASLPKGTANTSPDVRKELAVLVRPQVLLALGTTVMGAGAMFTLYTFVSPTLRQLTGASDAFVTLCLVVIGLGFTLGNAMGGRMADWSVDKAASLILVGLAVCMVVLPFTLSSRVGAVVGLLAWGMLAFAIVTPVQVRVMHAAADAPGLASSVNIGAFNLGNALGAAVGSGVLSSHLGYGVVPFAGAVLAILGMLLVIVGGRQRLGRASTAM